MPLPKDKPWRCFFLGPSLVGFVHLCANKVAWGVFPHLYDSTPFIKKMYTCSTPPCSVRQGFSDFAFVFFSAKFVWHPNVGFCDFFCTIVTQVLCFFVRIVKTQFFGSNSLAS